MKKLAKKSGGGTRAVAARSSKSHGDDKKSASQKKEYPVKAQQNHEQHVRLNEEGKATQRLQLLFRRICCNLPS